MRSKGGCPACVSLPRKREGWGRGTIERKRVTSLRGWRDLSTERRGGGLQIREDRNGGELVERKAEKGGKRDASASRSEWCGGCWMGWRASHGILV